jgi:hypothetical protein
LLEQFGCRFGPVGLKLQSGQVAVGRGTGIAPVNSLPVELGGRLKILRADLLKRQLLQY